MTPIRRHLFRSVPMLLLALVAASAQAADHYLKVIPGTALAWGVVKNMTEANEKIQKLATVVQAPVTNALEQIKTESGLQKGLDEKGAAGFFVLPGKTEKDPIVTACFVAVADEKEFLGNFEVVKTSGKISEIRFKTEDVNPPARPAKKAVPATPSPATHCVAFRNGYALVAAKSDRTAVETAVDSEQDAAAEMAGLEEWLAENDGTVVSTAAGIKYAAKQAGEELKKSTAQLGDEPHDSIAGPDAAVLKSVLGFYGTALEAAPKEFSLALAGIRCDKQGSIRIFGRARLVGGGLVSKAVASLPPVKENLLAGLPGGPFAFACAGLGVPNLADGYMNLVVGFMKSMSSVYGMPAEDLERMAKESIGTFKQVRSMSFVMKTGKRGDPIYSNMYMVLQVENSKTLLDLQEKSAANMNKLMQNAKQGILKSTTVKRLEIAGKPALLQEMSFDVSKMAGDETSRAILDQVLGVGGQMLVYSVAADEHTVLAGVGISQERMAAALDVLKQPKKGLGEDADVAATAAMLPADAQWVAYVSPRGYIQLGERVAAAALKGTDMEGFSMPEFGRSPPIGFALKATPLELHAEIAVPSELVQAFGDYIKAAENRALQPNQAPVP